MSEAIELCFFCTLLLLGDTEGGAGSFGKVECPEMSDIGIVETHLVKTFRLSTFVIIDITFIGCDFEFSELYDLLGRVSWSSNILRLSFVIIVLILIIIIDVNQPVFLGVDSN